MGKRCGRPVGESDRGVRPSVFVKPVNAGIHSVGVRKVSASVDLRDAVEKAFAFDTRIMIEKAVDCREIECAVMGNEDVLSSPPGEVIPRHEFYSYDAKYIDPQGADLRIPADLGEDLSAAIRDTAVRGYRALCCSEWRVWIFLEKRNGILSQRNQYSSRFYVDQHVSQAMGRLRPSLSGINRQADRTGHPSPPRKMLNYNRTDETVNADTLWKNGRSSPKSFFIF